MDARLGAGLTHPSPAGVPAANVRGDDERNVTMKVTITSGPAWAIGKQAKLIDGLLVFRNHMGEPHWYNASGFEYEPVTKQPAALAPEG
jgi:hypothetical protein